MALCEGCTGAYALDEAHYDGLVTFVSLSEMPRRLGALTQLPAPELRRLAQQRAAAFRARFRPDMIIARALARRWRPR